MMSNSIKVKVVIFKLHEGKLIVVVAITIASLSWYPQPIIKAVAHLVFTTFRHTIDSFEIERQKSS